MIDSSQQGTQVRTLVRESSASDEEWIAAMRMQAREEMRARRGGLRLVAEISSSVRALDRDRSSWANLVAVVEDVPAGYVKGRSFDGRGIVEELYVDPCFRSIGLGSELFEAITVALADHGCHEVDVVALPGDRSFKNILEAYGFKARAIVYASSQRTQS
ncbi:MAG: GNAT family N-acetyltransferase [Acidimicrobiales bacterium]